MPAASPSNHSSGPPRRSPRLKSIHMAYDEDSDGDSLSLKRVKIEVPDHEEILSPSTSPVNVASVSEEGCEQGFDNISLKDLRARCKTTNRKASKVASDGPDMKNQTQNLNVDGEETKEEFDLDKPLIALKQKRKRTSPSKADKKMDILLSSLYGVKVEYTTSEINKTPAPGQISLVEAGMHDSVTEKLDRRPTDLEHSTIAFDCIKEIVGKEDCCTKAENTVEPLVNCENPGTQDICSEEAGTICQGTPSCSKRNWSGYSAVELQEVPREDDRCRLQPCSINQPSKSAHVSDHSCELISSTKACNFEDVAQEATNNVSSLDLVDVVTDHQKTPKDIANSATDKHSIVNGFSVCYVNQSCDDYTYDDEYWNTEVVEGNEAESVTILEELSPINESNPDMMSPIVSIQSDLCGSTDMKCSSLEEVVRMQRDGQLDTAISLPNKEIKHTTTDYTFVFDKTHDSGTPANFVTQDGRLESIVYEALNNHTQKMTSENTSTVCGLPDTTVVHSTDFTNCPADEISLPSYAEQSLKNMNVLNSRIDYGVCNTVSNEGLSEVQAQLFNTCVNKEITSHVPSEISIAEVTQEVLAGAPDSSVTSLGTENRNVKSDIFTDEESTEELGPKKLLSKRKIMSPTSQEKLCNALTGIDLCGVKRLKNDIIVEDSEKSRMSLPHPAHNLERSAFSPDRILRGRTSISPTCKGVPKPEETPSNQQTTCSCKRSSPVVLDTEKAVEFSQRQMHDIENIAAKLIRSLKQMKSIVDETLSSEAYSIVPNFNTAEIRAASEDALEVEKTTRKWLSIMNKDCNRFCKILTLAKKKDVSAHKAPRKQRKITFADEAGGKLCHVKVFKDRQTSLSECQSDL